MNGMYLTRAEVFTLPPESFRSIYLLCLAVYNKWHCGISDKTAQRIIDDWNNKK